MDLEVESEDNDIRDICSGDRVKHIAMSNLNFKSGAG